MNPILQDMITQAPEILRGLMIEGVDKIEAAMAHKLEESQLNDTPAKFPLSFTITRDFSANKWSWKLSWTEKHTLSDETSVKDPSQPELPVGDGRSN
jgi:hypothetical protein